MAGLYNVEGKIGKVSILDAGAGSGILSCAFIERLETIDSIQEIELTCYENDDNVLPSVSYTHLDVYKRQVQMCTKIKKERRNEYGEYDENVYYRR